MKIFIKGPVFDYKLLLTNWVFFANLAIDNPSIILTHQMESQTFLLYQNKMSMEKET